MGKVWLTAPAPAGGVTVALSSSNLNAVPIDAGILIPAGQYSVTFSIGTNAVKFDVSVVLTASLNGVQTTTVKVTH